MVKSGMMFFRSLVASSLVFFVGCASHSSDAASSDQTTIQVKTADVGVVTIPAVGKDGKPLTATEKAFAVEKAVADKRKKEKRLTAYVTSTAAMQEHPYRVVSPINATQRPVVSFRQLPEGYRFVLNSDQVFKPHTAVLSVTGFKALEEEVIPAIEKVAPQRINIVAYTDNTLSEGAADRLTGLQADTIAAHIWAKDIAADAIHDRGAGSSDPAASNGSTQGQSSNRRVVITIYPGV